MKRILFFVKLPPPVNGATTMYKNIIENPLLVLNYKCKVIPLHHAKTIQNQGKVNLCKFFRMVYYSIRLMLVLFTFRPHLIYFSLSIKGFSFYRDVFYISIIKLFSNSRLVFHQHAKGIKEICKNPFNRFWLRYVYKNAFVICLSELLTYDLKPVYNREPYIVSNAIPLEVPILAPKKGKRGVTIIFVSNLNKEKGVLDYIDAISLLDSKVPLHALIIGAEGDISKDTIVKYIQSKGLSEQVKYLGPVFGRDKFNYLLESDIFVFPTFLKEETWGLVILEAMQCGLPVISTREGAIPDIIDEGITGFLVEKQRPEIIASKMALLINNPELRQSMGQKGREKFLQKYTLHIFHNNIYHTFKDILENNYESFN